MKTAKSKYIYDFDHLCMMVRLEKTEVIPQQRTASFPVPAASLSDAMTVQEAQSVFTATLWTRLSNNLR